MEYIIPKALNEGSILRKCVCTYVRMSRLGMSIALMLRNWASLKCALHKDVDGGRSWWGQCFSAMEDGEDSAAGSSQHTCTYLVESGAEASAECSQQLVTLTKNKTKRSVHSRSQESKKRTRKSSKVESTY